ncbi:MAG: hypothetical protein EPO40_03050 [Myxococcaceae bacterium]|nr:MAG: hypothetical protein EPO40_03050 [Myxococcaceae bacterium]
MTDTPLFDRTLAETLLDVDVPAGELPALTRIEQAPAARWMHVPAYLAGPCEDRPPHQLTDDDGIE